MRDDFAIFILSHGRAGNVVTLDTLQRCGYSGKIFIVVDDEDEQEERYIVEYGAENVIVFCKQEYADKVDTVSVSGERKTPLFVRNAICDLAKEMGFEYFGMWDDDISRLSYRYEESGKLKAIDVSNLDEIFEVMLNFMDNTNTDCMAFTNAGGLIGGLKGRFSEGLRRQGANTYIIRTGSSCPFVGVYNEDLQFSLLKAAVGDLVFELTSICFYAPERGTNKGGLSETYHEKSWYYINFHSVVCMPWAVKISKDAKLTIWWKNAIPCIINERWKKHA
jgi:hypothetical protein